MVILLRFNQRVRPTDLAVAPDGRVRAARLGAAGAASLDRGAACAQMDPQAPAAFNAKVAATRAIAESNAPVSIRLDDRLGQEDGSRRPLRSWPSRRRRVASGELGALADRRASAVARRAAPCPLRDQQYTIEVEKAFFVDGFRCSTECDPDGWNPVRMRSDVKVADFAKAVKATGSDGCATRDPSRRPPRRAHGPTTSVTRARI